MAINARRPLSSVCETWRHPFGWELRLLVEGRALEISNLVRSSTTRVKTIEEWRISMVERGWSELPGARRDEA